MIKNNNKQIIASDIHGSYARLKSFINKYDDFPIVLLGDILNNGSSYNESRCLTLLREKKIPCVRGNHDDDALARLQGGSKRKSNLFRKTSLERKDFKVLAKMEHELFSDDCLYVHNPIEERKVKTIDDAKQAFNRLSNYPDVNVCFLGHYHTPIAFSYELKSGICDLIKESDFFLKKGFKYLINPGSLGIYADYIVYDKQNKSITRKKL